MLKRKHQWMSGVCGAGTASWRENGIQLDPRDKCTTHSPGASLSLMDAARQLPRLRASRFDALNNDDGDAYDD